MDKFKQDIAKQAHLSPKREICGFILKREGELVAVQSPNLSPYPHNFRLDVAEQLKYQASGELLAYYHSHPFTSPEPSTIDKTVSETTLLPCYIYSCVTKEFSYYEPCGFKAPLEGREFVFGVHDCLGLVLDYYERIKQIKLVAFERTVSHLEFGFDDLANSIKVNNLEQVSDPKEHDIILMGLNRSGRVNHSGIYLGEDLILHHLMGRVSRKDCYSGYWKRNTSIILRRRESRL